MPASEPRVEVVDGVRTVVSPSSSGLPQKLDQLLAEMARFRFTFRDDFTLAGARPSCTVLREHRFKRFREGRWLARAGIRRGEVLDLHLLMCADCGAVQVRDVSFDVMTGLRVGRRGPNRRNHILDWYSGARPAGRVYR